MAKTEKTFQEDHQEQHKQTRHTKLAVLLDADDVVEQHVHGFANFLREYSVIGLAVGFVAGSQVAVVVKQLVASFIDPLFLLLVGKKLTSDTFTLHFRGRHADFGWGSFVYALLDFIFILIVIYVTIKFFKLDRFQKKQVVVAPEPKDPQKLKEKTKIEGGSS
jgi:large conductance mechanosensitive channel